jgi:hypothetical protein
MAAIMTLFSFLRLANPRLLSGALSGPKWTRKRTKTDLQPRREAMPNGGARPGAGRKPGVPNQAKLQAGFMRAAAGRKRRRGKLLSLDYLRKYRDRFDKLADEASADAEPMLHSHTARS